MIAIRVYVVWVSVYCFFFQAEDGIRDLVRSRGLGDVYKRQGWVSAEFGARSWIRLAMGRAGSQVRPISIAPPTSCLLYTSDAADDLPCVEPGGRRIIKKKKKT